MSLTASELSALRDLLVRARATSKRRISYIANGVERTVEFRNDAEFRIALADIERRLNAVEGRSSVNVVSLRSEKGFL